MKKTVLIALACLVALPAMASGPQVREVVSPSGIHAWLVEDNRLPIISLAFAFRGGVERDPQDKQGLATLTASLLTQGAGPYDAQAFQARLANASISLSLSAGRDAIEGRLKTLTRHQDEAFRLTSLALTQPRFDPADFERARDQQATSVRFQTASPAWQARFALFSRLFADHPYGYRSLGSPATLAAIGKKDVQAFAQDRLARDNLVVVAVGAINEAQLGRALDKIFGALPATAKGGDLPNATYAPAQTLLVPRDGTQTTIAFAAPMIRRDDPAFAAAEVANYILGGGGFESRLMKAVRAEKGLTYGISTGLAPMDKASIIAGSFDVDNDKAAQALALLKKEWADLRTKGASASEVESAKAYLTGSWPLTLTSTDAIAATLLAFQEKGLGPDYYQRRNEQINAVDTAAVRDVLTRTFDPATLSFAAVGAAQDLSADQTLPEVKD